MNEEHFTSLSLPLVGEQLRQARRDQQLSLEDVNTNTRIAVANLRAIEESDYSTLPADAYTKGFILSYAKFLGLDGQEMVDRFFQERGAEHYASEHRDNEQGCHALQPKKFAQQIRISSAVTAIVILTAIVISVIAFCIHYSWNPFSYIIEQTHSVITAENNENFHPADPATSNQPSQNRLLLQATFRIDCPVQVSIDGQPATDHTYLKGSTIQWEAHQSLHLVFFQDQCASFQYNGELLAAPPFQDGRADLRLTLPPPHGT